MEPFHIFIASCYEAKDIQLPRLIENILNVNFPCNYVHIILGGCPTNDIEYKYGIEIISVTYRCFEFTPFIYIVKNPDKYIFDYAFFTHDTVKFGNNFYNTLQQDICKLKQTSYECMKIENNQMSMNIGLYKKEIILRNSNTLLQLQLDNNNKDSLMSMKHNLCNYEDFILNQNNMNTGDYSRNIPYNFVGHNNTISYGQIRYFDRIDFIKYQSNANRIQSIDICKIPDTI